jgi:hypothetical protein
VQIAADETSYETEDYRIQMELSRAVQRSINLL